MVSAYESVGDLLTNYSTYRLFALHSVKEIFYQDLQICRLQYSKEKFIIYFLNYILSLKFYFVSFDNSCALN
jgi:hypothetical protein